MTTKQYLQLVEEIKNYVLELDCDYQRDDLEVIQVWGIVKQYKIIKDCL